ncbi:hypothetical protein Ae201684P_000679 [Aphanomyces euteiches]|uniref:Uncharacterized protein n=1 Tax=Aphanomyces euteiches TaxID=100861 RepID=A0A6G0X9T7_9STRA|nr:hypothetical protein Ae201684_006938 [Aphanomyces euteiches]KAH9087268.1 hypothetical protein Ae201684P_000679 [Aphanomyces euteiches]
MARAVQEHGIICRTHVGTNGSKFDLPERACSISSGRTFGCALLDNGAAFTWTYARNTKYEFGATITHCGWSHVTVLLADGSIKTCHIEQIAKIADIEPFYLSTDSSDPVVCLAAGDNFTVALSKHVSVFLWREVGSPRASNANVIADLFSTSKDKLSRTFLHASTTYRFLTQTKRQMMVSTESIKMLATGDRSSGVVLKNGHVLTWGNGSSALGLGRNDQVAIRKPQRIESGLRDLFVFEIVFGGWHSAALAFRINN